MSNSDDLLSDEDLCVDTAMLEGALRTKIRGKKYREDQKEEGDAHHMNSSAAVILGTDIWKPV